MIGLRLAPSAWPELDAAGQQLLADAFDGEAEPFGDVAEAVVVLQVGGFDVGAESFGPLGDLGGGAFGGVEVVHVGHASDSTGVESANSTGLDIKTQVVLSMGMAINPFRYKHQLRRAAALCAALDTLAADTETKARFAEHLELADWQDKVAVVADQLLDETDDPHTRFAVRPPSAETIAIARHTITHRIAS